MSDKVVKRSDIGPLIFLAFFYLFASGFFQIVVYGYNHPGELGFFENYLGPAVWWPGWTMITYGAILFWRAELRKYVYGIDNSKIDVAENSKVARATSHAGVAAFFRKSPGVGRHR